MHSCGARGAAAAIVVALWLAALPQISSTVAAAADPWPLPNHFFVPPIAFSPDGRYLALAGSVGPTLDFCPQPQCVGRLHVWDLRAGQRVMANAGPMARVMSAVFFRDNRYLVTGHSDGTVLVWGLDDFRIVGRFSCCNGTWIRALALSPDQTVLAIGAQSGQLVLWNIVDDLRNHAAFHVSRALTGHYYGVSSLVFDVTGEHLLSSADDQHLRKWDLKTGAAVEFQRTPDLQKAHRGMVKTVVILNNGSQALSGAYWEGGTIKDYHSVAPPDHILRLWDLARGQALRSYPLTFGIRCCIQVLSPGNRVAFLKARGWDEVPIFQIFDLDTGAVEHELAPTMGESLLAMGMHPNARLFVIAIGDGHYLLWDLAAGKTVAQLVSVDEGWAVVAADGRVDFSDGFRRWPCAHNIRQACLGGQGIAATKGLLTGLVFTP